MIATVDELSRLDLRITDFERRVAEEQENDERDSSYMGRAERNQIVQMLVKTLETMKALWLSSGSNEKAETDEGSSPIGSFSETG
jgi:hypothetical protein